MEEENKSKIKQIIEALLFATHRALTLKELRDVVSDIEIISEAEILSLLQELEQDYLEQQRSFKLEERADGFQLRTLPEFAPWISKLHHDKKEEKLTPAVLETLAIVAYRQPITKAEIEAVRGVDVTGALKRVLDLDLATIVGKKEVLGRPFLYGTSELFLKQFGLKNLDDLPRVEELKELGTDQKELPINNEEETPEEEISSTDEESQTGEVEEKAETDSAIEPTLEEEEQKEETPVEALASEPITQTQDNPETEVTS